jgi:cyclophilin family peptidyl-prolyl cis-trans isomerase
MVAMKNQAMQSPTHDSYDSDLPLYEKGKMTVPLHLELDDQNYLSDEGSSGSSSSGSRWQPDSPVLNSYGWRDQLSGGSSRPPSLSEESDLSSKGSKNSIQYETQPQKQPIPFIMVAFALVAIAALYTSRTTVTEAVEQVASLQNNRNLLMNQLTKTERDFLKLKREISAMEHMAQKQTTPSASQPASPPKQDLRAQLFMNQVTELKSRLQSDHQQVDRLKETVQRRAKYEVVEKYGPGPYLVEMELVFPDRVAGPHKFVIEMTPLDAMPHSVHTFLEMVTNGLLDGCSFILNALHVLKAAPLPYDGSPAAEKAKAFTSLGLESVSFKEYHESYPHKQYTVGFAADGSPSFYINTEDNSEIHVGDPCFGKIIDGFDTVRRLEAQPVRNGIWFEKRIGIKSARLVGQ